MNIYNTGAKEENKSLSPVAQMVVFIIYAWFQMFLFGKRLFGNSVILPNFGNSPILLTLIYEIPAINRITRTNYSKVIFLNFW